MVLDKYKEYRETQVKLHTKILDKCVSDDDFMKAAETLGIVKNNKVTLEADHEKNIILDFNVYEKKKNGKSSLSEYIEQEEETEAREDELLHAMEKSKTGLYEILDRDEEQGIVTLKELLSESDDYFTLVDSGLSKGKDKNVIVFVRLLHLEEFRMTSGVGFLFSADHKEYLLRRSKKLMKKINSGDASIDRFIVFFHLHRSDGLPTLFQFVDR